MLSKSFVTIETWSI